jgi:hypothetical protein
MALVERNERRRPKRKNINVKPPAQPASQLYIALQASLSLFAFFDAADACVMSIKLKYNKFTSPTLAHILPFYIFFDGHTMYLPL